MRFLSGIRLMTNCALCVFECRNNFVVYYILFTGAIGRAYMQLYTPLLPLKDEHELWLGEKTENLLIKGGDDSVKQENETGKNGQ